MKCIIHYWIDATNEKVSGTAFCYKCGKLESLEKVKHKLRHPKKKLKPPTTALKDKWMITKKVIKIGEYRTDVLPLVYDYIKKLETKNARLKQTNREQKRQINKLKHMLDIGA